MIKFEEFTGGLLETNCFLIYGASGNILIDAPQGADQHFADNQIDALLLTHGHFDHIVDAAALQKRHGCPIYYHADAIPMVKNPNFFRDWGFALEIKPIQNGKLLAETIGYELAGFSFTILEVPGHCPGSLCFYFPDDGELFSGDVLFCGSIGRTDFPGGDHNLLIQGIWDKILPLPDFVRVHPGHGPMTTVGQERQSNPWLQP